MSRLNELIAELCPNGVLCLPLKEIAYYPKNRIPAGNINEDTYVGVENLLQNKKGKTAANSVPVEGSVIGFEEGDILIGNIRPYLRKIWLADCRGGTNGDVLTIRIIDQERILPKYLYYTLSSDTFFDYVTQHSKGAKMPRGDRHAVMNYHVFVPPIEIQTEIVRILDSFAEKTAELEAALTAELEARTVQYEYYRGKLTTFKRLEAD